MYDMLVMQNIGKTFKDVSGNTVQALKGINLSIKKGEFVALFGPNGCGKTTLLNVLAGLIKPDEGKIILDNKNTNEIKVGYIFQNYRESLLPWLNVIDNISLPLKLHGVNLRERYERVLEICKKFNVNLNLKSFPYNLSGGQQQLVCILRALISNPDILLLDEPLSALDYQATFFIQDKLLEIWEGIKVTIALVSHEIDEAIYLADKIFLLSKRPARVIMEITNHLPRPRKESMIGSKEFAEIKSLILDSFIKEVKN